MTNEEIFAGNELQQSMKGLAGILTQEQIAANDKLAKLQQSSLEKLALLSPPTIPGSGYSEVSSAPYTTPNKLTGAQLQQEFSDVMDQQLYDDGRGGKYQERYTHDANGNTVITKVPFTQRNKYKQLDAENLYVDNTAENNMKLGLARPDKGFIGRYTPDGKGYGWAPGAKGVTPQDGALLDVALPYSVAKDFEYLVHNNEGQIRNRPYGTVATPKGGKIERAYGSGKTEYTTQNAPLWNQDYDPKADKNVITENTPLPKNPYATKETNKTKALAPDVKTVEDVFGRVKNRLAERESRGSYTAENKDTHFLGKYQLGAEVLQGLGVVKPGYYNKDLWNPNAWTGKHGIRSKGDFLHNKDAQEYLMDQHLKGLYNQVGNESTSLADLAGRLMGSHLLGVKGFRDDRNAMDRNKTSGAEYYNEGVKAVSGKAAVRNEQGKTRSEIMQELMNGSNRSIGNSLKALPASALSFAETVVKLPENLYKGLGGDYMEEGSSFTKAHPTYVKNIKEGFKTLDTAANMIHALSSDVLNYNPEAQNVLMNQVGKAYKEDNFVPGVFHAIADNPLGAIEVGLSSYAFSKAMAAKGLYSTAPIAATFSDNAAKAQEIYAKEHGAPAEGEQLAVLLGFVTLATAADTAVSRYLYGGDTGGKISASVRNAVDATLEKLPTKVAQNLAKGFSRVVPYVAGEAGEEALTEASVIAGGTQDFEKFQKPEYGAQIFQAAVGGALGGPTTKAADVTLSAIDSAASPVFSKEGLSKIGEVIKARQSGAKAKSTPVDAESDVAYTQEVNSRVAAQRTDINDIVDDVVLGETVDSVDQKAYGAKRDSLSTAFDAINDADDTEYAGPIFGSKRRAESYLSLVAESKAVNGTFDEAVERKMAKVAKAHGIEDERLQKIKNMATVEFEAVEGKRGYNSYFREMNNLMEDPKANAMKIEKLYGKVDTFLSTQEQALGIFEAAVQRAKDTMAAPSYQANPNKVKQETIKFPIGDGRKKEHTYGLSYSEAGIAQAEKVIAKKRQNMEGLKLVRDLAGKEATDNGVDLGGTTSGFVVPTSSNAKVQHDRDRDEAKYKRIGMTKAIVSEKSHKKWAEYTKYNKARVNASAYDKDDVVLIDTSLATKAGKVDMSDSETKAVVSMIKAAKKAGAAIIVETGTGTKLSSYKGVVAQLINDFGSGVKYRSVKVKDGKNTVTKFLPEERATEEKAKAAKATEAKKAKEKVNDVLFTNYLNTLDSEITEFDDVAEAKKAYTEARKVALDNFGDKDKMDAFLEGRKNKQVKAVAAALVQSAKEGGLLRVDSSTEVSKDVKDFSHHVIRAMAEDIANKFLAQYDDANEVLEAWKTEGMEKALEDANIKPQAVLKSVLDETGSSAKFGNKTLHSYVIRKQGDKPGESTTKHGVAGGRELTVEERKGGKTLPLNVAKYAAIKRTTVFNTLPVFALGQRVGMLVAEWKPAFNSFLPLELDTDTSKGHSQEEYAMLNSPARGLLIEDRVDGQVLNDNVLAAIATTMQESIKVNGYMLSDMYKNADDLKRVHGLQQTDMLSREAHYALNPLGLPWKMFGNDLGKNIAKQIGLARSKEGMSAVEEQQYDRLIADLGNMGILAGIAKGWFEVEKMPTSEYARLLEKVDEDIHDVDSRKEQSDVKFVRLVDFDTVVEEAGTNWDAISEELPDVSTFRKEYSTVPLTDGQIERKLQSIRKDRTGMVPGEKAREALIGQMKQAWKPSYTLIQEFLDNADSLKEHLGWRSDKKIEGLRFDQREIQVAVNRDIERTLEELNLLNTAMGAVEDPAEMRMYFEWFYSRNGRYMMDSNTINPQTGKQTDRFFVTPEEHETTYEVDTDTMTFTYKASGKSMPKGNGEKLTKAVKEILGDKLDVTENVLYSLAQAFGLKVDKDSAKSFNKSMRSLLELSKGKPEVVDGWKAEFYKEGEVKVDIGEEKPLTLELEHLGQAMQAFDFLKQWAEGKEITSSLSAETDAVTSGFGIKVAQMPVIGRWLRYALKVGIVPKALLNGEKSEAITKYLEQDKAFLADHAGVIEKLRELGDDGVSMNELLAGGLLQDSYQTQGAQMVDIKLSNDHAELDKALGKYSKGNTVTKVRQAYHDLSKTWDTIVSVLPKHIEGEKVSSEIRSLFKSPFMTFNYSASIKNIRLALSNELADKLLDKMYAGGKEAESIFKALKFPAGYKLTDLQQDLAETSSDMIKTHGNGGIKVREYLVGLMNVSYGYKLEAVLSTEFKEFIAVQDLTNSAFQAMYYAYDVELQEALKGVQEAKGFVTKEDVVKVQDGLRGLFPAIKGPFSNEENELVAIIGDKMVTPVDGVAVQTPIDKKFAGKHGLTQNGKPQESVKIWQVVKAFAAAVSAGSVVPVHYIDGANMGLTLNEAAKELGQEAPGMTSVHDATIGMLPLIGHDAKTYNKHFVELSQSYNMFDSIAQAMEKIAKHVAANEEKYKHAPKIASIQIDGEYATKMPIMEAIGIINGNVQTKNVQIKEARQALKDVLDESGAYIMHMASTAGGVHHYEGKTKAEVVKEPIKAKDGTIQEGKPAAEMTLDELILAALKCAKG